MLLKSSVLKFETVCQGQCVNKNILAVIFRDKFWPKFQQEFWPKFQQEFLPKFQNFGSNLNKIFYKILANLNILPIIFAVVLLSLLQYYSKNPVRNLVSISAILLLKYCYTFSYRLHQGSEKSHYPSPAGAMDTNDWCFILSSHVQGLSNTRHGQAQAFGGIR